MKGFKDLCCRVLEEVGWMLGVFDGEIGKKISS
jgi:hypothetical protein